MRQNLDYYHEHCLRTFQFNPHLPLQLIPPVDAPLPSEPTIRITVERDGEPGNSHFVCTPRGVVNSLRRNAKGDLYIGRLVIGEDGNYANDIILRATDYQVSRRHCCLYYGAGLGNQPLTQEMLAFLMGRHVRLGASSAISRLPTDILRSILSFLAPKRAIYLTDCGSLYGTYIRARCLFPLSPATFVLLSPISGFQVVSTTWAYSILINSRSMEVRNGAGGTGSGEDYTMLPVLWIVMMDGDPTYRMSEGKVVALTPARGNKFELQRSGSDPSSPASAFIYYLDGQWCISESDSKGFGVWVSTSQARREEGRYSPRWVEVESGVEVRVSATVIRMEW